MSTTLLDYVALSDTPADEPPLDIVLHRPDGTAETQHLPAGAARAVRLLLERLKAGGRVALLAEDRELTPNEAAEILGFSRPLVIHRMNIGRLPYRMVGAHRRCRLSDVLALKVETDAQQRAVEALAAHGEELEALYGL